MISPLKPILTFFGVKDGKIEATALKRIADSLNNLINTYVAWADTVGQDYSISNFIKWLKNSQGEIVATELRMYALKAATLALNMVFAMFAGWVISAGMNAFINWMKNAKTHSEQLISTMEDAHDAAEEAQQDVDDIQQKLDDLDQKVKDLGAEKIEDIVDPQEKAKIQEINNLLETQLRLKKQIADDENNKANKAASDVFNDKSEVVVSNETPTSYAEADPNGIGVTVTPSKNVTRTEALREHTARVNELSDAYVKLMSDENATDEERAQAKKNLEDEISLTNDAGTKVSELADMYETDASKYGDVSSEVQECTDSMQGASDALERANNLLNGTTSVENTNLDAFKSKFKDVIEEIDNGYLSMQEAIAQYKDLSPLQAFGSMTGEAIINIDSDTAHQTEAEATALAKLHEIADANNISFEDLIGAFEQLGIVATSDTSGIANYATQLEETMKAIDSLQSSYKSCSSAVEEYNKYGYLSTDTMQSLLQMDTEYLNCLDLKDGKLQINKQRYAELLAAQYAQAEVEAIDQAITELNTIAKGDAAEKTQTLTTATEDEKNKLVALCPALEDATVGTGELAAALAAAQGAANGGKGLAEVTGSAAAGAGMSAQGPNAKLSGAAAAAAAGVGSIFESEYDEILGDTNEFMSGLSDIFKKSDNPIIAAVQSMIYMATKTVYRMSTVGKINSSKTVTESTSNTKKAAQSQISSMTSNFESSWKSVAGELGLDTKDIEETSKKMSEKMNELVNNTFDALNENTGLSAEQVEDVTNTMFDSLQKIYTSGWNSLASTSGDMSKEIADKLNASYKSSVDSTNKAMNEISKAFGHSWSKVGGGVKTLSTNVQKTMEQAWADTSKDTQKLMYDMRACFDNSWSMNEAGVTNLAEMTQGTVKDGYAEIDSSSSNTFGENGQLKTDADNSWKNVEPGATNLANNMQWVMDQSYKSIKDGCTAAVTSIKNDLATTGDAFEAVATKAEKAKQETQQQQQTAQQPAKQKGALENIAEGAGQFIRGVGQGIADVVTAPFKFFGSLLGFASGTKEIKKSNFANVDEQGPEMLVRQPQSGRYTYLETGDGVVPADITSRLFEMGGNPDAWFQKQMAKYGSQPIVQGGGGDVTTSIGDIIITNPVGSSDALANEIKQKLPTKVAQMQSKR